MYVQDSASHLPIRENRTSPFFRKFLLFLSPFAFSFGVPVSRQFRSPPPVFGLGESESAFVALLPLATKALEAPSPFRNSHMCEKPRSFL